MGEKKTNTKKVRRLRLPLLMRISILFLIAFFCAGAILMVLSASFREKRAVEEASRTSLGGCRIAIDILKDYHYDPRDEHCQSLEFLEYLNKNILFKQTCKSMNLRYLYVYLLDDNNHRVHLISVAADPEDQKLIDESAPPLSVSTVPLSDEEARAWAGDDSGINFIENNEYGNVCVALLPYKIDGEVLAMVGADCSMEEIEQLIAQDTVYIIVLFLVLFVISFFLLMIFLRVWVLGPIRALSDGMEHFIDRHELKVKKRKIHMDDEVSDMEKSFHVMANEMKNYVQDVRRLTAEKVEADVQLQVAKRIQSGMVPPYKELKARDFAVSATMMPAREVGGDFYDVFEKTNGEVVFVIGDISGKGISAAMFMEMTRRILRERLMLDIPPRVALKMTNDALLQENPENFFATAFVCVWDANTHTMTYSNAGHNPPLLIGRTKEYMDVDAGVMLGLFDDAEFLDDTLTMDEGEGILLYTDGVTEALDPENKPFGEDRLLSEIRDMEFVPEKIVKTISSDVRAYEGEGRAFDDVTLIAFCRAPQEEIDLKRKLTELEEIKAWVMRDIPEEELRMKVMTACEEWFVNIISYSGARSVKFSLRPMEDGVYVTFTDDGKAFDPASYDPSTKDFEELDTGGMGIEMIRDLTKEIKYNRVEGKNVMTMYFTADD